MKSPRLEHVIQQWMHPTHHQPWLSPSQLSLFLGSWKRLFRFLGSTWLLQLSGFPAFELWRQQACVQCNQDGDPVITGSLLHNAPANLHLHCSPQDLISSSQIQQEVTEAIVARILAVICVLILSTRLSQYTQLLSTNLIKPRHWQDIFQGHASSPTR